MPKIMLLEDDLGLVEGLSYTLEKEEYGLSIARSVKEALSLIQKQSFDLFLLDVTLPDGSGYEVLKAVHEKNLQGPVLFLTAMDEEFHIIKGLDMGADDYITKPFKLGELLSRIRAALRRAASSETLLPSILKSGPLSIHLVSCEVLLSGKMLELTQAEYRLLVLFLKNKGQTLTREIILNSLWDKNGCFVDDNTLSVYIRRLREKIEPDPSHPVHLLTIRGFGYKWKEEN